MRFEEEFNFGENDLKRLSGPGFSLAAHGQRNRYAIMTNAIYDIPVGWIFSPHLGVGIGAVNLHDSIGLRPVPGSIPGAGPCAAGCALASSSAWEFGYQAIAGIRYKFMPSLAFDLDYRYLATTDPSFKTLSGLKYKSEYSTHNVVASLTWLFVAPPPPPPPQPVAYPPPPPPPPAGDVEAFFTDGLRTLLSETNPPVGVPRIKNMTENTMRWPGHVDAVKPLIANGALVKELGTVERAIKRVKRAHYVLIPAGPDTHGHFSDFYVKLWKPYLIEFLARLDPPQHARPPQSRLLWRVLGTARERPLSFLAAMSRR